MKTHLAPVGLWLRGLSRGCGPIVLLSKGDFRKTFHRFRRFRLLRSERGSASTEFVLWVIPLFIPLIILIGQVSEIGSSKIEAMQLARTALRAFVSAPDAATGHLRVKQVLAYGGRGEYSYFVRCKSNPCIQPNNIVQLTLNGPSPKVRVVVAMESGLWVQGEPGFNPIDVNSKQSNEMTALENALSWLESLSDAID